MMDGKLALDWDNIIRKTAGFIKNDFPEVQFDDIIGEAWCYVLSHPKVLAAGPSSYGITTILSRQMKRLAWNVRKEQLQKSSRYLYQTSSVRQILETTFDYRDWPNGWVPKDAYSKDGMAPVEIRADVTWGLGHIPPQYRDAIWSRYALGQEPAVGTADRRRLNRAVQRLTDVLNYYYPRLHDDGPGTRRVMTNATARYIREEQG